jgi:hypothetical protein
MGKCIKIMPWSKELQEGYAHIAKIKSYLIDCVICECPITPIEQKKNEGMCDYCHAEVTIRKGRNHDE